MLVALVVLVTSADGRTYRLGPDERDAGWVPENIQFGTALPGGWKEASFNLRRRADEDVPLRLLDEVQIIDQDGSSVYEGRIQQLPRQSGDDFLLGVNCLGWAAHLLDDTSFVKTYIDMDLGRWQTMSGARRRTFLPPNPAPYSPNDFGVESDASGSPSLKMAFDGGWQIKQAAEAWFDAGAGDKVSGIYFRPLRGTVVSGVDTNWSYLAFNGDTDASSVDAQADQHPSEAGIYWAPPTRRRYVGLQLRYDVAPAGGGTVGQNYPVWFRDVAVYGDHGLQGAGDDPLGLYVDDILADALLRAAPKINFTTGPGGSIQRPPLLIRQAAYRDPGSVENVVLDLNKYTLWDWGVYDNRTFFYRPTDPDRLTWEARLDEGIHLSLEGDDAEHAYNGAMVKYTDTAGTNRVAGPTGSEFDIESDQLGDFSPDNTVNQHGYPRKWIELDVQFPLAADVYATTIGSAYLAQASLPARSGSIELTGQVRHPTKGMRPVYEVRAGDWIDTLSGSPADVPRRIVSTSYNHDTLTNTVTVGNDVDKISSLLEQLGVLTTIKLG